MLNAVILGTINIADKGDGGFYLLAAYLCVVYAVYCIVSERCLMKRLRLYVKLKGILEDRAAARALDRLQEKAEGGDADEEQTA